MGNSGPTQTALLVGASRGLGLGLTREYLARGWRVIATERTPSPGLASLTLEVGGRLRIEHVDVTDLGTTAALRSRLADDRLDLLFLIAGISGNVSAPLHAVPPEEAAQVYLNNAYYPIACAERFVDLMKPDGVIAFMTSFMGSIGLNNFGTWETYRTSKAALNMAARSFFLRHQVQVPTVLSVAPGWVRTDMGGAEAPLDIETSVRSVVDAIAKRWGLTGHACINHDGTELPW
jgi:NAD(P)-dependent dehydrogenase (short-subunit alcohol dehydrogenase family)